MENKVNLSLNEFTDDELLKILHKNINECLSLRKENDLYEFILDKERNLFQKSFEENTYNVPTFKGEGINNVLTSADKCHFLKKCLAYLVKILEIVNSQFLEELQELKFKLKSTNMRLLPLKDEINHFKVATLIKSRHPVTKKIILQKVENYFHDSIEHKMTLANRIKTKIESLTMERCKVLKQMNEQKKRLTSLDTVKYQETKLEHIRICDTLAKQKELLAKCKFKFNSLAQHVAEIKKMLKEQEVSITEMKSEVAKMEQMKIVILTEKSRNEQKIHKLNEAMHKIKLDPRSQNLPEVIEYAVIKRQNENLKQNIKQWRKKLAGAEELKLLYLNRQLQKKR